MKFFYENDQITESKNSFYIQKQDNDLSTKTSLKIQYHEITIAYLTGGKSRL